MLVLRSHVITRFFLANKYNHLCNFWHRKKKRKHPRDYYSTLNFILSKSFSAQWLYPKLKTLAWWRFWLAYCWWILRVVKIKLLILKKNSSFLFLKSLPDNLLASPCSCNLNTIVFFILEYYKLFPSWDFKVNILLFFARNILLEFQVTRFGTFKDLLWYYIWSRQSKGVAVIPYHITLLNFVC